MLHALILILSLLATDALAEEKRVTPVQEKEVQSLIQAMDFALQRKDLDGVLAQLSDTAQIHLQVTSGEGSGQILQMSPQEYRTILATTVADAAGYQIERKAPHFTPLTSGKMLYTDFITETIQAKGKQSRTLSEERMVVERVGGKVKISALQTSVLSSQ